MKNHSIKVQLAGSECLIPETLANENTDKWLASVSDDLSKWLIFDFAGNTRRESLIDLNFKLADGNMLTDAQNRDLFIIAIEYLLLIRVYSPDIRGETHHQRVKDLLTFYYWLSQRKVRSLQAISQDHIELYTEEIAFGAEWATQNPHQLIKYLQHCRKNNKELPKENRYLTRVSRSRLYRVAGMGWHFPYCNCISVQKLQIE